MFCPFMGRMGPGREKSGGLRRMSPVWRLSGAGWGFRLRQGEPRPTVAAVATLIRDRRIFDDCIACGTTLTGGFVPIVAGLPRPRGVREVGPCRPATRWVKARPRQAE